MYIYIRLARTVHVLADLRLLLLRANTGVQCWVSLRAWKHTHPTLPSVASSACTAPGLTCRLGGPGFPGALGIEAACLLEAVPLFLCWKSPWLHPLGH